MLSLVLVVATHPVVTLTSKAIVRATRLRSRHADLPVDVPFTTVAKGPIWARVDARYLKKAPQA